MRYVPRSDSLAEFEQQAKLLCARSNVVFVIEEAERYLGQGKPLGPYTFDLINRGRNWGIGIVAVTRRIQRLSKDYFDLCQHIFFFKCGLKSRGYIEDMAGWSICQRIISLPRFHFVYLNLEDESVEERWLELGTRPHIEGDKGKEGLATKKQGEEIPVEGKKVKPPLEKTPVEKGGEDANKGSERKIRAG